MGFWKMEMARPTGDLLDCIIGEESVAQLWGGWFEALILYILDFGDYVSKEAVNQKLPLVDGFTSFY